MKTDKIEIPKEAIELSEKAALALDQSGKLVIVDDEGYQHAAGVLKGYKSQAKELTAKRKELTGPLDVTKKGIMDFFRKPLTFLEDAERVIKKGMIVYQDDLEAKRKAEQERLDKIAEKERKYQEDLAKKRLATAEKNADEERVEEVKDEIEEIQTATVAPIVDAEKPKAAGVSTRVVWSGEVTDKMALIKAVAAGTAPATLLDVNSKVLNQMARAMKEHLQYPGIKANGKKTIAA